MRLLKYYCIVQDYITNSLLLSSFDQSGERHTVRRGGALSFDRQPFPKNKPFLPFFPPFSPTLLLYCMYSGSSESRGKKQVEGGGPFQFSPFIGFHAHIHYIPCVKVVQVVSGGGRSCGRYAFSRP